MTTMEDNRAWVDNKMKLDIGDWRLEKKIRKSMMDVQSECEVIPRDFLCCKICDEEYKEPKYLLCFHSFCGNCIEKHENGHEGCFWCPVCGTETTHQEYTINNLPDNVLVQRLLNPIISSQQKDKLCKFCKNGGNFIDAKTFCINCDDFLCRECTDHHMEQGDTQEHRVETLEEHSLRMNYEESAKSGRVVSRCCSYYDPLDIGALFCVDCDIAVCGDCHLSYHEEHRCAEMTAVAENFSNKIKQPLEELQADAGHLQEAMVNLQKAEIRTIEQQKELHNTVKKRKKYLYDLITQYENVLLEEIDRRHTQNLDDIHLRRKEIQMHLAAIDGVSDFTEKLLQYGSCEEKVLMRKKVGKRVRELCEEPLQTESLDPHPVELSQPPIAIESVCNMFGELSKENILETQEEDSQEEQPHIDSGHSSEAADNNEHEQDMPDQEPDNYHQLHSHPEQDVNEADGEYLSSTTGSDIKMLSLSNSSDALRNVKFREEVEETEYVAENCFTLDSPKREITLPHTIQQECLKGIGINKYGDIIVGASAANYQMVYLLEKRGIIRGQIPIQTGWNIHTVSADGKVALTVARGDNRYKVRIMKNDVSGKIITSTQIDNFGLNFVTADDAGNLIVASNRYAHITNFGKMTSKAGGNLSIYGHNGILKKRVTNEDYQDLGMYILEKPHCISINPKNGKFYVADPGSHNVTGYDSSGELLFEYGNTDHDPEIYDGPDLVCTDTSGNVLVADKRQGRVDVLSEKGELKKSLFTEDIIKFIAVTPDKQLMLATAEGNIKFYEYSKL